MGFGSGGYASGWVISFPSPENSHQETKWEAVGRIPIVLDRDKTTGHYFIVSVKPYSNGTCCDNFWPSGKQNPYYVFEFDGQLWKEVPLPRDLIGRKNNLVIRFDHFYVKSPTPSNDKHVSLEEKSVAELEQDKEIKAATYKYNLKYRIVGEHPL